MTILASSDGDHEMSVPLGTPIGDVIRTLAVLPWDSTLVDFYGDVELLLVIREPGRPAAIS